ncbi:MAG: site-specific integrase [Myxococcales bacterium]|nr:site-specific integrase [Myxococcales bacterium]
MKRRNIRKIEKRNRAGELTGGHVYRARYEGPDGKERTRHFATKKDAVAWLNEQSARIVTGAYIDPNAGKVTFVQYAEEWRTRQVHRESTARDYETQLRLHTYPTLGGTQLGRLEPSQIQAWVRDLSSQMAPATVRKIHGIVAGILNDAVRDRRIASNPCAGTKLPEIPERQIVILRADQVLAIRRHMPTEYQALIHLAVATGVRQGEAFGLTADRVDFLRRQLRIDRQMIPGRGGPRFGPPKTKRSNRTIPIPQTLVEDLSEHVARFGVGDDGLLFTAQDGGPVRRSTFNGGPWRKATDKAGCKGATFHMLRHYYASLLIRYGESVKTVQARLGHATAAETLDTYGHLWPDSDDRTREAASAALWLPESHADLGTTGGQRASDTPA